MCARKPRIYSCRKNIDALTMKTSTMKTGCAEENEHLHIIFTFAYIWIVVKLLKCQNYGILCSDSCYFNRNENEWELASHLAIVYYYFIYFIIYRFSTFYSFVSNFYKRFITKCPKMFSYWYFPFIQTVFYDRKKSNSRFSISSFVAVFVHLEAKLEGKKTTISLWNN